MKKTDILIKIEHLSLYFSCLEQTVREMNDELNKISSELLQIRDFIEGNNEKKDNN